MSFSVDSFVGLTPVLTATSTFDDWDWSVAEDIVCESDGFDGVYRHGEHVPERTYVMADYIPTGTPATYAVVLVTALLSLGGPDGYFLGCHPANNGFPWPESPIIETIALEFTPSAGTILPRATTFGPETELAGYLQRPTLAYHGDLTNDASILLWPLAEARALSVVVSYGPEYFGGHDGYTMIQVRTFSGVDPDPDDPDPDPDPPGTITVGQSLSGVRLL